MAVSGTYDHDADLSVNIAMASPLLSRFDLILLMLDTRNAEWDRCVTEHLLDIKESDQSADLTGADADADADAAGDDVVSVAGARAAVGAAAGDDLPSSAKPEPVPRPSARVGAAAGSSAHLDNKHSHPAPATALPPNNGNQNQHKSASSSSSSSASAASQSSTVKIQPKHQPSDFADFMEDEPTSKRKKVCSFLRLLSTSVTHSLTVGVVALRRC